MVTVNPCRRCRSECPCLLIYCPNISKRLILFIYITTQSNGSFQTVSDLCIYIWTEIPSIVIQRTAFIWTFLFQIAQVEEVLDPVRATIHTDIILFLRYIAVKQLVCPICTLFFPCTIFHHLLPSIFGSCADRIVSVEWIIAFLIDKEHMIYCTCCFRDI